MASYTVLRVASSHLLQLLTALADIGWVAADGMRNRQDDQKLRVILAYIEYSRTTRRKETKEKKRMKETLKKTAKLPSHHVAGGGHLFVPATWLAYT